jgi:hypothetical protein
MITARAIFIGAVCFLVGAISLAFAASTTGIRPEVFIGLPWTWSGIQTFGDGKLKVAGATSDFSTLKAPATAGGIATLPAGAGTLLYDSNIAHLNLSQSFAKPQRVKGGSVAISTSTFTFDLDAQQDFEITLVHASCPCTIANPTNIAAAAADHQHGVIRIKQSSTGSDTVGTWGGQWIAGGGVATLTLSTAANAEDYFSYDVIDSTHILITAAALNAGH